MSANRARAVVSKEGKLNLPSAQRHAAGIRAGTPVIVEQVGDELRVRSVAAILKEMQAWTSVRLAGRDSVDAFLRDKYEEAEREEAEP